MTSSRLKWWSSPREWIRAILMLDDTPHSIALGSAIGMFIAMTPTVGIQMILVGLTALATRKFFHFNRVAALIMVYVSNPLTVVPIYWFNYKVGTYWFPAKVTRAEFEAILEYQGIAEWWDTIVGLFVSIGLPLIVGSLVVATACAIPTYPAIAWAVKRFKGEPAKNSESIAVSPSLAQQPSSTKDNPANLS